MKKGIFWIINDELLCVLVECDANGTPLEYVQFSAKSGNNFNHQVEWSGLERKTTKGKPYNYYRRGRVEIKNSPFNMNVTYERKTTPILSRKETVEPKDFLRFFREFRQAYKEYYPLFYMFTVSAQEWYDGFSIVGADC